jgi:hypothetical protein
MVSPVQVACIHKGGRDGNGGELLFSPLQAHLLRTGMSRVTGCGMCGLLFGLSQAPARAELRPNGPSRCGMHTPGASRFSSATDRAPCVRLKPMNGRY